MSWGLFFPSLHWWVMQLIPVCHQRNVLCSGADHSPQGLSPLKLRICSGDELRTLFKNLVLFCLCVTQLYWE